MILTKEWDVSVTWEETVLIKHVCRAKANDLKGLTATTIADELNAIADKFEEAEKLMQEPWEEE